MKKKVNIKEVCKTAVLLSFFVLACSNPEVMLAAQAAQEAFTAKFTSFKTLFTDMISTLGTIYTLWCISEWGLAWHESNGTMGGQSFKRIFGGLVVILSPQILTILS